MARVNKSQFAVLGCLSIRPMSAYEIKQFIARSVSYFWSESEAQLYPTLKQLSEKGLVSFHEEKAAKAGTKKVYALTELGQQALAEWLQSKNDREVHRNEMLLKVFFGNNQPSEVSVQLLETTLQEAEEVYQALSEFRQNIAEFGISEQRMPFVEMSMDYGLVMLKAEADWCRQSIQKLQTVSV